MPLGRQIIFSPDILAQEEYEYNTYTELNNKYAIYLGGVQIPLTFWYLICGFGEWRDVHYPTYWESLNTRWMQNLKKVFKLSGNRRNTLLPELKKLINENNRNEMELKLLENLIDRITHWRKAMNEITETNRYTDNSPTNFENYLHQEINFIKKSIENTTTNSKPNPKGKPKTKTKKKRRVRISGLSTPEIDISNPVSKKSIRTT